jgi:hypothetical protein
VKEKNHFGKKFFYEVLISIERINVQKSAKSEMITGRLVDSYKKPLLSFIVCEINFEMYQKSILVKFCPREKKEKNFK